MISVETNRLVEIDTEDHAEEQSGVSALFLVAWIGGSGAQCLGKKF